MTHKKRGPLFGLLLVLAALATGCAVLPGESGLRGPAPLAGADLPLFARLGSPEQGRAVVAFDQFRLSPPRDSGRVWVDLRTGAAVAARPATAEERTAVHEALAQTQAEAWRETLTRMASSYQESIEAIRQGQGLLAERARQAAIRPLVVNRTGFKQAGNPDLFVPVVEAIGVADLMVEFTGRGDWQGEPQLPVWAEDISGGSPQQLQQAWSFRLSSFRETALSQSFTDVRCATPALSIEPSVELIYEVDCSAALAEDASSVEVTPRVVVSAARVYYRVPAEITASSGAVTVSATAHAGLAVDNDTPYLVDFDHLLVELDGASVTGRVRDAVVPRRSHVSLLPPDRVLPLGQVMTTEVSGPSEMRAREIVLRLSGRYYSDRGFGIDLAAEHQFTLRDLMD